jgi:hypothetical protein
MPKSTETETSVSDRIAFVLVYGLWNLEKGRDGHTMLTAYSKPKPFSRW